MNRRTQGLFLFASLAAAMLILSPLTHAVVVVDDSFADGDFAKTGALDTNWWTSSSSSGKEISPGSLGLVTGSSGRGIHTIFPEQTIANVGDLIKVTYSFTTPATVGTDRSTAFRVGLFDSLGRAGLDADVNASSGSPNELYGWGPAVGGPGTAALPGYMFDHDVNTGSEDLNFREHLVGTPAATGRLMGTTSNFDSISSSGPDGAYTWAANESYSGMLTIRRLNATDFKLVGVLNTPSGSASHSVTDAFDSDKFSFLGFHVNSRTFGDSNTAGEPDNGIDFSNIRIETIVPEPTSLALLSGAALMLVGLRRRS